MTPPAEEPVEIPTRSQWALWGTAHLAWGLAIFLSLLYAAQQFPVQSTAPLQGIAWAMFLLGLVWIGLSGWRSIERGWRLRSPTSFAERPAVGEMLVDLAMGLAMLAALLRGSQSRLLAAGLDRLVSAVVTVSLISVMLWVIDLAMLRYPEHPTDEQPEQRLRWTRLMIAGALIALAALAEFSRW